MIKFVENMKMKFLAQIISMWSISVKKGALKKVHIINDLSLFLKNYVLISQFRVIHSIYVMCVHMCKQVCVSLCVHMYVFEHNI